MPAETDLDLETAPETAAFRKGHLMRWHALRATRAEQQDADTLAALRAQLSELLTRAPVPAVIQFLAATRSLNVASLLSKDDALIELIESVFPRATWASSQALTKEAAADEPSWDRWARAWCAEFSATGGAAAAALKVSGGKAAKVLPTGGTNAMLDLNNLPAWVTSTLKFGQLGLRVYLELEGNRQKQIAAGEPDAPMTLEAVLREAQCHVPDLAQALAGLMGDEQQARACVEAVTQTPDMWALFQRVAGMAGPGAAPPPNPSARPSATVGAHAPPVPRSPAPADPPAPANLPVQLAKPPRSRPPEFRADLTPRGSPAQPAPGTREPAATNLTAVPPSPGPREPAASTPTTSLAAVPPSPEALPSSVGTSSTRTIIATSPEPQPEPAQQRLEQLERWAEDRSRELRERGERLEQRFLALATTAGLSLPTAAAPPFRDPVEAASTVVLDDAPELAAFIDATRTRIARRHALDEQFFAWMEERFEDLQALLQHRPSALQAAEASGEPRSEIEAAVADGKAGHDPTAPADPDESADQAPRHEAVRVHAA